MLAAFFLSSLLLKYFPYIYRLISPKPLTPFSLISHTLNGQNSDRLTTGEKLSFAVIAETGYIFRIAFCAEKMRKCSPHLLPYQSRNAPLLQFFKLCKESLAPLHPPTGQIRFLLLHPGHFPWCK